MKRKLLLFCLSMVLVLSLYMAISVPAMAEDIDPNTPETSTLVFRGTLTHYTDPIGTDIYTGTIAMVDEAAEMLGDLEAGFDILARDGMRATYDKLSTGSDYACGYTVMRDAWTTGGGWGTFCDPDCQDWYNYQLTLTNDSWALEYNADVGNDGILTDALCAPMSGFIDWVAMYAVEMGAGAYYEGMGTAESPGYALDNACTGQNTGQCAWDMDWSWGSEYVPLQYPGYRVTVIEEGEDIYTVIMVPEASSSITLNAYTPEIVAIQVDPASIHFGALFPGQVSDEIFIHVNNIGSKLIDVDADLGAYGTVFDHLQLEGQHCPTGGLIVDLPPGVMRSLGAQVTVPQSYSGQGQETNQLIFEATASD